jgi:uncharacterized protein (TIGR03437 family)
MPRLLYPVVPLIFFSSFFSLATAQPAFTCSTLVTPLSVRGEGITERVGDVSLNCAGGVPEATVTGNFSLMLNVHIANRLAADSPTVTDLIFTVDNGSGPQPVATPGILTAPNTLAFNWLSFTLSSSGSAVLRIANLRAAANELMLAPFTSIQAFLGFDVLQVQNNQLTVAMPLRGLYASESSKLICAQGGSPLPDDPSSFASFLASKATFNTTRVTEGFADAFSPRSGLQGLNADTGTRIMVSYSGFPPGARIFVPNVIAGSDSVQPTAGGDFGLPASGGRYAPGNGGSLLLARVFGTDATGAGGSPIYSPGAPGSGTVSFDAMNEVTLTQGAGIAVYEVVDSDPAIQESAQFPTFLSVSASPNGTAVITSEDVSFAPVSTVQTASPTAPIPRFQRISAPPDCAVLGDCDAQYFPRLTVLEDSLAYTAQAGTGHQVAYVQIQNAGGGLMQWATSVQYANGSGWLQLYPASGENNATIRIDAVPGILAAGTYSATLTIDAGPVAGARTLPVTFVVTNAPPPPVPPAQLPTVTAAVNAATFATGPLVPGSLAALSGTKLSGNNVTVTFDELPAQILYDGSTQLNVLVPGALSSKTSAQLVVSVDGDASAPLTVNLAAFAPGIFQNGILNQDNSVNGANHPASPGSVIQIFATGLSGNGAITAKIGDQVVSQPYYAGPAPSLPGVQQVNLIVPQDLAVPTAGVSVCGAATQDQVVCSPAVQIAIGQ